MTSFLRANMSADDVSGTDDRHHPWTAGSTDIAYVYGDAFNGMGYITRYLIQAKSSNFASEYAKREAAAITQSNDFIEQFLSNE